MKLIQTVTVGSGGSASIEFTSIPDTATDLIILLSGRGTNGSIGSEVLIRLNGDAGTNYAYRYFRGSGSAVNTSAIVSGADSAYGGYINGDGSTANVFGNQTIYIPNYTAATNKYISVDTVSENNATAAWILQNYSRWNNTGSITSIALTLYAANFKEFSRASLYGITKGSLAGVTVS